MDYVNYRLWIFLTAQARFSEFVGRGVTVLRGAQFFRKGNDLPASKRARGGRTMPLVVSEAPHQRLVAKDRFEIRDNPSPRSAVVRSPACRQVGLRLPRRKISYGYPVL